MLLRHTRAVRALVAGAAALAGFLPAIPARAQTGELPEDLRSIADVRFVGIDHVGRRPLGGFWPFGSRRLVGAGLRTRRPSALPWRDRPQLRRDFLRADSAAVLSFYRHYGYLDAAVNVRLRAGHDPRTAIVVFEVREGPLTRVSTVDLDGVHVYTASELEHPLLAQPKQPFDPVFLQLDTLKIKALYLERGYRAHVEASARLGVPDSVHAAVRYAVDEGPQYRVGSIGYEDVGKAHKVREMLGRREWLLKPGDVYRRSKQDLSVERMYGTGLFRSVQVSDYPDSTAATIDLDVRVSSRPPRWLDIGIGSGTSNRYQVSGEWGHRNLDTRALGGVLDAQVARDGQNHPRTEAASFTLSEPWLLGLRLLGQSSLFYRNDHDRADPRFVLHAEHKGFNFSLYRELGRIARITLVQQNDYVRQGFDVLSDPGNVVRNALTDTVVSRYRTNTLRLTLERDMRNDRISPTRGSYQVLSGELAGGPLKGTSSYRKTALTSTWYTPTHVNWLVAMRATGGVMQPFGGGPANFSPDLQLDPLVGRVPRDNRFYIGGVNSLRGYAENSVPVNGGLVMMLANVELRVPLAGPLGAEFFVDAGNVWDRPAYVRAKDFVAPWQATRVSSGDIRYSYGVGARLVLPFGPLRIDLAWSDRPDFPRGGNFLGIKHVPFAYQFAIGPTF